MVAGYVNDCIARRDKHVLRLDAPQKLTILAQPIKSEQQLCEDSLNVLLSSVVRVLQPGAQVAVLQGCLNVRPPLVLANAHDGKDVADVFDINEPLRGPIGDCGRVLESLEEEGFRTHDYDMTRGTDTSQVDGVAG